MLEVFANGVRYLMIKLGDSMQSTSLKKPSFILGLGCQKGGTSWLHDYLSNHPSVDMGFVKEYHVFDALYVPECSNFYDKTLMQVKENIYKGELASKSSQTSLKKLEFLINPESYFEYFHYLYIKNVANIGAVGDITPSYSSLPVDALFNIREGLINKGFVPKVIFIMRDPLERCWSSVRMSRRNELRQNPDKVFKMSEEEETLRYSVSSQSKIRTRYDLTLNRVFSVFDESEVMVLFYETMFSKDSIEKVVNFFGIEYIEPSLDKKKNVSEKSCDFSEETKKDIVKEYAEVYEWAFLNYGEDFIKDIWKSSYYI